MPGVRIGLIGYGGWARQAYRPALNADGRARVVAAAAATPATRGRITADLGPDVDVFDGFAPLLARAEIDAVMIAVPDALHAPVLDAALAAGLPLLYEPPVADVVAGVRPRLQQLLAASAPVLADLELSYLPVVDRAAQLVAAGALGEPRTAAVRLQAGWGAAPDPQISTIHLLAPWYLDPLERVLARRPARILVADGRGAPGRMQPYAAALLDYGELWASFQVSLDSPGGLATTLEVNGATGDLVADLIAGDVRWRTHAQPHWRLESLPAIQPHAGWPGMHECVRAFLDAVESGEGGRTGPTIVAGHHLTGLAAEQSIDSGGWANVDDLAAPTSATGS